jgi:hypothetical protein
MSAAFGDKCGDQYVSGNGGFTWTLTPDTAVPDLMMLIDADTCL